MDICVAIIGYIMFSSIYVSLFLTPMISPKYWIFFSQDASRLPPGFNQRQGLFLIKKKTHNFFINIIFIVLGKVESKAIEIYQRKGKAKIIATGFNFYYGCLAYSYFFLWYNERFQYFHFRQYIFWFGLYPFFLYYHVVRKYRYIYTSVFVQFCKSWSNALPCRGTFCNLSLIVQSCFRKSWHTTEGVNNVN